MGKVLNLLEQAQAVRQAGASLSSEDKNIAAYGHQMALAAGTWNDKYDARNPINYEALRTLSRLFSYITLEAKKAGYDEIVVPFKPDEPVAVGLKSRIDELVDRTLDDMVRRNGGQPVDPAKVASSLAKISFQTQAFVPDNGNINSKVKTCLDLPLAVVEKKGLRHG